MKYHTFSLSTLVKTVIARLATEPAAVIGLVTSVGELFAKGWTPDAAIPAAVGLFIRFWVTPTSKVSAPAPVAATPVAPLGSSDQAGAVSAVELCLIVLTGLAILWFVGYIR